MAGDLSQFTNNVFAACFRICSVDVSADQLTEFTSGAEVGGGVVVWMGGGLGYDHKPVFGQVEIYLKGLD